MATERSTKRQKELLNFVATFVREHGYGPSYREIMNGMGYKSVSTVAIHIDGLISKGYLRKRDHSARSLEVVSAEYGSGAGVVGASDANSGASARDSAKEKWLVGAIETRFTSYAERPGQQQLDELYVLVGSLKILGFEDAYQAMRAKLARAVKH